MLYYHWKHTCVYNFYNYSLSGRDAKIDNKQASFHTKNKLIKKKKECKNRSKFTQLLIFTLTAKAKKNYLCLKIARLFWEQRHLSLIFKTKIREWSKRKSEFHTFLSCKSSCNSSNVYLLMNLKNCDSTACIWNARSVKTADIHW